MKNKILPWVIVLAGVPTLFQRPLAGETLHHGTPLPGNSIPEGSAALCPGVPEGEPFIANLRTGWAVETPGDDAIRLVFSDREIACQDDEGAALMSLADATCSSGWTISLLLPPELQVPGRYQLSGSGVVFRDTMVSAEPGGGCRDGCQHAGSSGGTVPGAQGPNAELEIFSATDECITGRLHGLKSGQLVPPPPNWDGAFHAVRCTP